MAVTNMDTLVAALAGGEIVPFNKASITTVAGTMYSLWTAAGQPGAGSAPGAAAIPTVSTAGAMAFTAPAGGVTAYLASMAIAGAAVGNFVLADRLAHMGGLDATLATLQTVSTPTLTRFTGGKGVEAFVEIYTAIGATARTLTVNYTNQDGTSKTTTVSIGGVGMGAGRLIPIPLAAGDYGVRSVESVQLSASTGTAGNFGITLVKRLAEIPIVAVNTGNQRGVLENGLPTLDNNACLMLMLEASSTSSGLVLGDLMIAKG